ncbi:hypothetical protein ACFXB3_11640 [Streptomyces sp. NPDC059447]|uniref:hypothetical protein n=1 Tax=Streptomyces sp. NPDC059447 TaxID=3346834 RepID=UPI00369F266C
MTTDAAADATARRTVRTYHEARFRGDVTTAAAQIGEGFRRITAIDLIFDSAPWQALMAAAGPTRDEA